MAIFKIRGHFTPFWAWMLILAGLILVLAGIVSLVIGSRYGVTAWIWLGFGGLALVFGPILLKDARRMRE